MRTTLFLFIIVLSGCGLFNPEKYNPNPRPIIVEQEEEPIRVDTIRLTNGVDHIIILDTLKFE